LHFKLICRLRAERSVNGTQPGDPKPDDGADSLPKKREPYTPTRSHVVRSKGKAKKGYSGEHLDFTVAK